MGSSRSKKKDRHDGRAVRAHMAHAHPLCPADIVDHIAIRVEARLWDPKVRLGKAVGIVIDGYLRHKRTHYERLMDKHQLPRWEARQMVRSQIETILASWKEAPATIRASDEETENRISYVAIIDGQPGAYGVIIPDCPGCVAMGATIREAQSNAGEALLDWAVSVLIAGGNLPAPSAMEVLRIIHEEDFAQCLGVATITLDVEALDDATDVAIYDAAMAALES